ncbi:LexA family protein [Aquimarina hainanensis]|uniref:LexA family protein n=1 Tax=Aquimarina hainanensis TaxID=1578017 RepID=UPI00360E80FB
MDEKLIKDKDATFYARVKGDSMINAGLGIGDLLVIDRSIEAYNNCIAVFYINNEFTVKRLLKEKDVIYLCPENEKVQSDQK